MIKPGVYITFDVECSMGGAWKDPNLKPIPPRLAMMGEYGDKTYGIPLICEILNRYNLKATFFLEPFNDELGYPGETEHVAHYLKKHGQDIQLHIHPGHIFYQMRKEGKDFTLTDDIADLQIEQQTKILIEGLGRLEKWTNKRPIAFRAGNMGASEQTLEILSGLGVWIDSSYTFPYVGGQCYFKEKESYNGSKWYGDVLEVALSGFRQPPIFKLLKPAQPLDLMGTSFPECREVTRMICDAGADAVAILHSFSLFKVKNVQYYGGRLNRIVTRRFENYCKWLSSNKSQYPVRTFSELGSLVKDQGYIPKNAQPCLLNQPIRSLTRKVVQGLNNIYWF